jgi:hypothetical protein
MSKDTIDLRTDAKYDLVLNKAADLNAVLTCQYYTGTTEDSIVDFNFSAYTGASLICKQNYRSATSVLEFDTCDGSIVLSTGSTFQLLKTGAELANLPIGEFEYTMWLRSATQSYKAFLSGKLIIQYKII